MGVIRSQIAQHWPRRPVWPLEIDWANPITNGLVGAWSGADPDGAARNIAKRFPDGTLTATNISQSVSTDGPCWLRGTDITTNTTNLGDPNLTENMTASIWLRLSETQRAPNNVPVNALGQWNSGGSPGTNAWLVGLSATGVSEDRKPFFSVEIGTTVTTTTLGSVNWNIDDTMFFCGTRNGTSLRFYSYMNGVWAVATGTCGSGALNVQPTHLIRFGDFEGNKNLNVRNGKFWEPRVWNRALNAGEVYSLFDPLTRWDIYRRPSQRVYAPVFSKARFDDSHQIIGGPM